MSASSQCSMMVGGNLSRALKAISSGHPRDTRIWVTTFIGITRIERDTPMRGGQKQTASNRR